jgi:hypothetical protein
MNALKGYLKEFKLAGMLNSVELRISYANIIVYLMISF